MSAKTYYIKVSNKLKATVIVPAYNEEAALPVVLNDLINILDDETEIIVVVDGSSDNTSQAAGQFSCKVIEHPTNMGKGLAVQTGVNAARGEKIVLIDADNTYPAEAVPRILKELETSDIVFTQRNRKNIPKFNLIGNKLVARLLRYFWGFQGNDPLSGLYGMKKDVFKNLAIESANFTLETEVAIKVAQSDLKVAELSIEYKERIGESKLKPVRDGLKIFQLIAGYITGKRAYKRTN